jgi:hypothetical protein
MTDIWVERDGPRFLLTGRTDRGRDWLNDYANEVSQWWGKSLIVKKWEIDGALDAILKRGLEFTNR